MTFSGYIRETWTSGISEKSMQRPALGDQQFDLIVDDASHIATDQIKSFEILFPYTFQVILVGTS